MLTKNSWNTDLQGPCPGVGEATREGVVVDKTGYGPVYFLTFTREVDGVKPYNSGYLAREFGWHQELVP